MSEKVRPEGGIALEEDTGQSRVFQIQQPLGAQVGQYVEDSDVGVG